MKTTRAHQVRAEMDAARSELGAVRGLCIGELSLAEEAREQEAIAKIWRDIHGGRCGREDPPVVLGQGEYAHAPEIRRGRKARGTSEVVYELVLVAVAVGCGLVAGLLLAR
jgi:hypothetical protein